MLPKSNTPVNFSNSEGESPDKENDLLNSCFGVAKGRVGRVREVRGSPRLSGEWIRGEKVASSRSGEGRDGSEKVSSSPLSSELKIWLN